VKLSDGLIVIVETKGLEDVDVEPKLRRLKQWCEDVNRVQGAAMFDFVFVDEASFDKYQPKSFHALLEGFRKFKNEALSAAALGDAQSAG
jgi:type III restriction enzyme